MKNLSYCLIILISALLVAPCSLSAKAKKENKPEKVKQEKMATLYKNARTALKNQGGQDAARAALLRVLARPELKNK